MPPESGPGVRHLAKPEKTETTHWLCVTVLDLMKLFDTKIKRKKTNICQTVR